jgi:hypothetical protein
MNMRAKLRLSSVEPIGDPVSHEQLTFNAVGSVWPYPPDGSDENNTFAKWTPSAELKMSVANPALHGQFKVGQEFYVDFTPA